MAHMPEIYCTLRNAYIYSHVRQVFPAMRKSEFVSRQSAVLVIRPCIPPDGVNPERVYTHPTPFPCMPQNFHFVSAGLPTVSAAKV